MSKSFESVFPALNSISKQLEFENKLNEILEAPNHIANAISTICPTLNYCDSLVNNIALLQSDL